jgi:hypothetical protein
VGNILIKRIQERLVFLIILLGLNTALVGQDFPYFDGQRAYDLLKIQCDFGPRYPHSPGHQKMITFLGDFLEPLADTLLILPVEVVHPRTGKPVSLTNFLARFNPDQPDRVLLLAHWDTRAVADQDPEPANRTQPILGANDGASGVAILLHLAEILHANPQSMGIDLLLVDGEDMGIPGQPQSYGLGTREFARQLPKPAPRAAICLDMVGDAQLELFIERYSLNQAPELVREIWNLAEHLGYPQFKNQLGTAIVDDHRIFYEITGIPALDIIDFQYPNSETNYWHTLEDTPDKCSPASLEVVGTVMTAWLYNLTDRH